MKIINKILTVFLVFFAVAIAFAGEVSSDPPPPTGKSAAPGPPQPPAPIDGNGLLLLLLAAILLGTYVIYAHKLKTKASV